MGGNEELVDSWKADFQQAYGADTKNSARQSFEDYWNWVKVFLVTGWGGQRGWLEQGNELLRVVKKAGVSEALLERLRAIGKAIAAEWAKENRSRRVYSTFLQGSPNLAGPDGVDALLRLRCRSAARRVRQPLCARSRQPTTAIAPLQRLR